MLKPPSLKEFPLYPVTLAIAGISVAVTGLWWSGWDIDPVAMNWRVWTRWELWRAITSIFPHVNFFHLAFNLYWFWVFGTLLERVYGHVNFLVIVLLLALGSSLADFMLLEGGVGLSGVGYGLWAMLWVLERRDARFNGAVDSHTSQTFVAWFFLCIILTFFDIMPVANIAHAAGAGLGALLGLIGATSGQTKNRTVAQLVAVFVALFLGSTFFWPWVNCSKEAGSEIERAGLDAMDRGNKSKAVKLLEVAAGRKNAPARAWYNLGIAYQRNDDYPNALRAYEKASNLPDADPDIQKSARDLKEYLEFKKYLESNIQTLTNSAYNPGTSRNTN